MESLKEYLTQRLNPERVIGDDNRFELLYVRAAYSVVRGHVLDFYEKCGYTLGREKGELLLRDAKGCEIATNIDHVPDLDKHIVRVRIRNPADKS